MHRPRGVGLAGAVHRTWAVAEKNDWQFSNPRMCIQCEVSESALFRLDYQTVQLRLLIVMPDDLQLL